MMISEWLLGLVAVSIVILGADSIEFFASDRIERILKACKELTFNDLLNKEGRE